MRTVSEFLHACSEPLVVLLACASPAQLLSLSRAVSFMGKLARIFGTFLGSQECLQLFGASFRAVLNGLVSPANAASPLFVPFLGC